MTTKTITATDGTSVDTAFWEVFNDDGPLVLEVSAQCGAVQITQRMTFGPMDGAPADPTQDAMQAALDAHRLAVADIAVAHAAARTILTNLS